MAYELYEACFELSLRWKTTTIQKDPEHLIHKIVYYVNQVRRVSQEFRYEPAHIIASDETDVWTDLVA